jgi:hypothetical protein
MAKTSYFNNGEPQISLPQKKMQPVILSDCDKPIFWDCFWRPFANCMGFIPYVIGLPEGCVPLPSDQIQEILQRWEGEWQIQPLPPMAIRGHNSKFYMQFTTAHIDGDNLYLSGGFHDENRVTNSHGNVGGIAGFGGTNVNMSSTTTVQVMNEGEASKFIFFRSPDGRIYVDNIGTYLDSETSTRIRLITAMGWPMTLLRNASEPKETAVVENNSKKNKKKNEK